MITEGLKLNVIALSKKMKSIKRSQCIKVYVLEEEKAAIEERANGVGKTSSDYLRSCGLERVIINKPSIGVITIRTATGILSEKLAFLKHSAVSSEDRQLLKTANDAISLVNEIIVATFNLK